ncbi:MAG: Acylamidase [Candidatus Moanabacter tarae]|uniref:Acylamidase n=1 Tax=Candidatus Moanibacter tarae TaxID=2200854 RepID=A0A2Z4AIB3_9BACT|nr:MAG: Acylamidase [Candidatus Moanabacter tarae]|tara:strand:+ start:18036 stop:19484 length:1449 start_codon:yes stop_codon:yes gene_type:complete
MFDATFPGYTPAYELRRMIGDKELSPVELVEATLRRIDADNSKLGSYITVIGDEAIEAARVAETAVMRGDKLGPLHGIPVPIKDLEGVAGVRLTHGSVPADEISDTDALCVERIRSAGGIIIGKTNTPEFGHAGTTENTVFGPSRNPWNLKHTPGGSSGGAAVSVAAGMTSIAQGSDGGGSIRIPCAFSGIYGIKATQGRVPRRITSEHSWHPVNNSSVGPMTGTVLDSAVLLNVLSGPSPDAEYTTINEEPPDFTTALGSGVRNIKMGLSLTLGGAVVDSEVANSVLKAAEVFSELGAEVEEVDFRPKDNEDVMSGFLDYFCVRGYAAYGNLLKNPDKAAQLTDYFRENLENGRACSTTRYISALNLIGRCRNYTQNFFDRYNVLLTPVTAVPAFPINEPPSKIGGCVVTNRRWGFIPFTPLFNLTGNPAASIPCGFSAGGLPIGLHIIGPMCDEKTVIAVSAAFEKARPWTEHRPNLSVI